MHTNTYEKKLTIVDLGNDDKTICAASGSLCTLNSEVKLTLPLARVVPPIQRSSLTLPGRPSSSLQAKARLVKGPRQTRLISPGYSLDKRIMAKAACSLCATWRDSASGRPASPRPSTLHIYIDVEIYEHGVFVLALTHSLISNLPMPWKIDLVCLDERTGTSRMNGNPPAFKIGRLHIHQVQGLGCIFGSLW